MNEILALLLLLPLLFLAVAGATIALLALSRRDAEGWRVRAEEMAADVSAATTTPHEHVQTRRVSWSEMSSSATTDGSGYFDARTLPGFDRFDQLAETVEAKYRASAKR